MSAQDVARHYGLEFDRRGWCKCPFHRDKHPSMSFRAGRFRCWACNESGNSIDFTCKLLGLSPLEAIKQLNADFLLGLPIDRQQTPAERQEAEKAAQHRRKVLDTYQLFERWRSSMIQQLTSCFREGHLAIQSLETPVDLDKLTDAQALAIREQARLEWLADVLTGGTMAEQMEVFRERGQIKQLCEAILSSTSMKSKTA